MEDKVLVSGSIGTLGTYQLEWKSACLMMTVQIKLGPVKTAHSVEVDSMEAFDEIAKAIPGTIDDAVIGVIKAALAAKKSA